MHKSSLFFAACLLAVGCDSKKESTTPAPDVTAASPPPPRASASVAAPSTPPAASATPARKITLRELVWTEKTPAETKFVDCVLKACSPPLKECYGERVEQGELGGPCRELATCQSGCLDRPEGPARAACVAGCEEKHRKDGSACDTCGDKIGVCSDKAKCDPPIVLPH